MYNKLMFTLNKCLVNYCNNHALSTFDQNGNLCSSDSYCLDHIPNPGKIKDDIYNYIATHEYVNEMQKSVMPAKCASGLVL